MIFSINASWSVTHKRLYFLGTPTRQATDLHRLRKIGNCFEVVVDRGAADVEPFRKFFDGKVLLHFPHLLPVNRRRKNMYREPGPLKKRRGEEKSFCLQKE
jgi:hypothetical protein